jgi:DNA invertase Pin-like site-specific DNA recombinase
MTRTAIYTRVSTPGQKDTTSLPEQLRLDREKAEQLGWDVSEAHIYREVESGSDLYRPEMERLWWAIERREIDGLVIDVLDRLSRDEGDVGAVYHHADRYGVTIELSTEDKDETEKGRAMRTLTGMMARMERVEIMRRTQRGKRKRATDGKLLPGATPLYGYLWSDPVKKARAAYIVDPETACIVVRIWERIADGVPIRALARELNADGIPTPAQVLAARGQLPKVRDPETGDLVERDPLEIAAMRWQPGTIGHILHHPAYLGQHSVYRYAVAVTKERLRETGVIQKVVRTRERAKDDPMRIPLSEQVCPPLISPELAARVQAQLAANKANSAGNNPDPLATIWRGMGTCGHCGAHLVTTRVSNAKDNEGLMKRRYRCATVTDPGRPACPGGRFTIGASTLDPEGWADVVNWLKSPENVARLMREWEQSEQHAETSIASRIEASSAHLASLHERMDALAEDISATLRGESRRVLNEKLDELAEQVTRETAKREKLLAAARAASDYARDERDIREWVCEVAANAQDFTREERRAALYALGAQVTVWRADHVHADGWPQRYKIVLTFAGFTGHAVTLPARYPGADIIMLLPLPSGNA